MARQQITAGSAPLLWSNINDAFEKINSNFADLYASVGGGEPFDFTQITTSIIPATNTEYDLGSGSKRWRTGYFSRQGISIGGALINSDDGLTLNLPSGTTIDGELIRNPEESSFKTFAVAGQENVVANNFAGTVTLVNGSGITITTNSGNDSITFSNNGIVDLTQGTGITISGTTNRTITNSGVTQLSPGLGISVSSSTGSVTLANSGIVDLEGGTGITIGTKDPVTGKVVITNSSPASTINCFRLISVSGEVNVTAQNSADTLTLVKGTGIDIETTLSKEITFINTGVTSLSTSGQGLSVDTSTGSVTIDFDNHIDIIGSVFADDSSIMIDATDNSVYSNNVNVNNAIFTPRISSKVGDILPMQITAGQSGSITGNISISTYSNSGAGYGGSVGINTDSFTVNNWITVGVDVNLVGRVSFSNGVFSANSGAYFEGNLVGNVDGDITGSVFSDGSTMMIDGTEGKIIGPVESPSVYGTSYIQTAVYADASAISTAIATPTKGMIVFNDGTGKFQGWTGATWADLN